MNKKEAEDVLVELTGGTRPEIGDVLTFTEEGYQWVSLERLEELDPREPEA